MEESKTDKVNTEVEINLVKRVSEVAKKNKHLFVFIVPVFALVLVSIAFLATNFSEFKNDTSIGRSAKRLFLKDSTYESESLDKTFENDFLKLKYSEDWKVTEEDTAGAVFIEEIIPVSFTTDEEAQIPDNYAVIISVNSTDEVAEQIEDVKNQNCNKIVDQFKIDIKEYEEQAGQSSETEFIEVKDTKINGDYACLMQLTSKNFYEPDRDFISAIILLINKDSDTAYSLSAQGYVDNKEKFEELVNILMTVEIK